MKIGIVTDTSCNFTKETAKELGIHVIPMQIIIDDHTYQDAIDITLEEFYKKMETAENLPTTSQPAIGEFIKIYEEIIDQYDKIISIHPSGKLSGTVKTAEMAANQVDADKITVFDSEMVSILSGYQVLEAKRLVDQGENFKTVLAQLEDMKSKTLAYVMLENIDNLIKSGRIPNIAGKVTKLAKIKPILKISSSGIELERIVRTSKRALKRLEKMTREYIDDLTYPVKVDVAHGDVVKRAEDVLERLKTTYPTKNSQIHRLASVIGVHTGPGIIGFTMTPDYKKM